MSSPKINQNRESSSFHNPDFLILPSIGEEDFPNVVLEAMSYGKCRIANNLAVQRYVDLYRRMLSE